MAWPVREWPGGGSEAAAIAAVGGMVVVPRDAGPDAIRRAVTEGTRALELHGGDLSMLAGTPVEFLHVVSVTADLDGLRNVPRLRGLSVDAWSGNLDLASLPSLEWLHVAEVERPQFPSLAVPHATLRHLRIGRYRDQDLSALGGLAKLQYVSLWQAGALVSLAGLPKTVEVLALARCPRLASLKGAGDAARLQAVILESCNRVEDLSPLARIPDLRLVQIDMRAPPSLEPLVGHPTLEFVWVVGGARPVPEIEALLRNPSLRMVNLRRASWMRTPGGWRHVANVYALSQDGLETHEALLQELNRRKTR